MEDLPVVVDDDRQIFHALRINLKVRHYDVETAADGTDALNRAASFLPDLVVLDLGLPDLDGVDVIHGLRGWTQIPIIVLSGRAGSQDKVDALDAGADGYVTKPFSIDELLARIRAVTRRARPGDPIPVAQIGNHLVDLASKIVHIDDQEAPSVHLTPTEWQLLKILLHHPGGLISQQHLLTTVWDPDTSVRRELADRVGRRRSAEPVRGTLTASWHGEGACHGFIGPQEAAAARKRSTRSSRPERS